MEEACASAEAKSKSPETLTSVVLAWQAGGVEVFRRSPQRPRSISDSQSHAVVPLILLDRAGLVPQHVDQGSGRTQREEKGLTGKETTPGFSSAVRWRGRAQL